MNFFLSSAVGKFDIKNVVPTSKGEATKVKVKLRLNIHGIFSVRSASLIETIPAEEKMEVESATPTQNSDGTAAPPPSTTAEPAAADMEAEEVGTGAEEKQEGKTKGEEEEMSTEAKETPPEAAEPGKDGATGTKEVCP